MDEDREALASAWLAHWALSSNIEPSDRELADEYADTLLPVVDRCVRRRAAEELRAAAEESTYWVMTRETVYTRLNEHADALEAE